MDDFVHDRVGIGVARRNPIQEPLELAGLQHALAHVVHEAEGQQLLDPELRARAAARAQRRRGVSAEPLDFRDQLRHALPRRRLGLDDRRPPSAAGVRVQRQQRLDGRHGAIGALTVGLVDDEDVGDFHDAGLERLHLVAGTRHERHDRDVGGPDDVDFILAHADGLDEDDRAWPCCG